MGYKFASLGKQSVPAWEGFCKGLLVQSGADDGDYKMGEVGSAFVELKPADNAVVGKILGYARFRNAKMFRKLWLDGIGASAAGAAAQEISYGDAKGLAGLHIVVAGEIGIGENEDAWADGSMIGFVQFGGGTGQQPAKLHFEKRQSGREAGIAGTAANA